MLHGDNFSLYSTLRLYYDIKFVANCGIHQLFFKKLDFQELLFIINKSLNTVIKHNYGFKITYNEGIANIS